MSETTTTTHPASAYMPVDRRLAQEAGDPRAARVLQAGYEELQDKAARMPDEPTRHPFLENVPWHREIE